VDTRLSDEKIKTDYMFKLNYFRYNLAHAEESKMLPPPILEKLCGDKLLELSKEIEEKGIKIPGYNQ
jgi:hypothetical protein